MTDTSSECGTELALGEVAAAIREAGETICGDKAHGQSPSTGIEGLTHELYHCVGPIQDRLARIAAGIEEHAKAMNRLAAAIEDMNV